MSRFTDDYPFFGGARKAAPATLNMLLNELGVDFASPEAQRAAIKEWLKTNEPGPRLAAELRDHHLTFA